MKNNAQQKVDVATAVGVWLGRLTLGVPMVAGPLEIVPVLWAGATGAVHLLAHQAIADGGLEVLEKDGGVVQELLARSTSPRPILILEGETLVGARQNRMVAHSVVVGPGMKVVIPVGCMERGRWQSGRSKFGAGVGYSAWYMRRDAKQDVMASRRRGMGPTLEQGRLWEQVASELARERMDSMTSDFHVVMEARTGEAARCVEGIRPVADQVGVMAMRDGAMLALEVVGHPQTWAQMSDRVLASLVPAAMDASSSARRGDRGEWMSAVSLAARRLQTQPAVGLGCDVEIRGAGLIGSGVWMGDRFAHLSVYARA